MFGCLNEIQAVFRTSPQSRPLDGFLHQLAAYIFATTCWVDNQLFKLAVLAAVSHGEVVRNGSHTKSFVCIFGNKDLAAGGIQKLIENLMSTRVR